ncbi:hypothetical protein BGW38_006421, partial [Lunasporangiospora selenospora]
LDSKPLGILHLVDYSILTSGPDVSKKSKFVFRLSAAEPIPHENQHHHFYSDSEQALQLWLLTLQAHIDHAQSIDLMDLGLGRASDIARGTSRDTPRTSPYLDGMYTSAGSLHRRVPLGSRREEPATGERSIIDKVLDRLQLDDPTLSDMNDPSTLLLPAQEHSSIHENHYHHHHHQYSSSSSYLTPALPRLARQAARPLPSSADNDVDGVSSLSMILDTGAGTHSDVGSLDTLPSSRLPHFPLQHPKFSMDSLRDTREAGGNESRIRSGSFTHSTSSSWTDPPSNLSSYSDRHAHALYARRYGSSKPSMDLGCMSNGTSAANSPMSSPRLSTVGGMGQIATPSSPRAGFYRVETALSPAIRRLDGNASSSSISSIDSSVAENLDVHIPHFSSSDTTIHDNSHARQTQVEHEPGKIKGSLASAAGAATGLRIPKKSSLLKLSSKMSWLDSDPSSSQHDKGHDTTDSKSKKIPVTPATLLSVNKPSKGNSGARRTTSHTLDTSSPMFKALVLISSPSKKLNHPSKQDIAHQQHGRGVLSKSMTSLSKGSAGSSTLETEFPMPMSAMPFPHVHSSMDRSDVHKDHSSSAVPLSPSGVMASPSTHRSPSFAILDDSVLYNSPPPRPTSPHTSSKDSSVKGKSRSKEPKRKYLLHGQPSPRVADPPGVPISSIANDWPLYFHPAETRKIPELQFYRYMTDSCTMAPPASTVVSTATATATTGAMTTATTATTGLISPTASPMATAMINVGALSVQERESILSRPSVPNSARASVDVDVSRHIVSPDELTWAIEQETEQCMIQQELQRKSLETRTQMTTLGIDRSQIEKHIGPVVEQVEGKAEAGEMVEEEDDDGEDNEETSVLRESWFDHTDDSKFILNNREVSGMMSPRQGSFTSTTESSVDISGTIESLLLQDSNQWPKIYSTKLPPPPRRSTVSTGERTLSRTPSSSSLLSLPGLSSNPLAAFSTSFTSGGSFLSSPLPSFPSSKAGREGPGSVTAPITLQVPSDKSHAPIQIEVETPDMISVISARPISTCHNTGRISLEDTDGEDSTQIYTPGVGTMLTVDHRRLISSEGVQAVSPLLDQTLIAKNDDYFSAGLETGSVEPTQLEVVNNTVEEKEASLKLPCSMEGTHTRTSPDDPVKDSSKTVEVTIIATTVTTTQPCFPAIPRRSSRRQTEMTLPTV